MNRRSSQLSLPGVAPLCPHCGGRRTLAVPAPDADAGAVTGQQWECRGCGRTFWSLPSLGTGAARR